MKIYMLNIYVLIILVLHIQKGYSSPSKDIFTHEIRDHRNSLSNESHFLECNSSQDDYDEDDEIFIIIQNILYSFNLNIEKHTKCYAEEMKKTAFELLENETKATLISVLKKINRLEILVSDVLKRSTDVIYDEIGDIIENTNRNLQKRTESLVEISNTEIVKKIEGLTTLLVKDKVPLIETLSIVSNEFVKLNKNISDLFTTETGIEITLIKKSIRNNGDYKLDTITRVLDGIRSDLCCIFINTKTDKHKEIESNIATLNLRFKKTLEELIKSSENIILSMLDGINLNSLPNIRLNTKVLQKYCCKR